MDFNSQSLLEAALRLPESEQVALVAGLLERLAPHESLLYADDPPLVEELDRRLVDTKGAVPWSELNAET